MLHVSPTSLYLFCFQKVVFPNLVFPLGHKFTNFQMFIARWLDHFTSFAHKNGGFHSCRCLTLEFYHGMLAQHKSLTESCSFILSLRLDSRLHINQCIDINFHKTANAAWKYVFIPRISVYSDIKFYAACYDMHDTRSK